jgi:hypothetical protein
MTAKASKRFGIPSRGKHRINDVYSMKRRGTHGKNEKNCKICKECKESRLLLLDTITWKNSDFKFKISDGIHFESEI